LDGGRGGGSHGACAPLCGGRARTKGSESCGLAVKLLHCSREEKSRGQ
jgi:hypothetical protein